MDGARFIFGSLYSALQLVGAIGAVGTNVTVLEEDLKKKLLLALSLLLEHADPMLIVSKNSEDGELDLEAADHFMKHRVDLQSERRERVNGYWIPCSQRVMIH